MMSGGQDEIVHLVSSVQAATALGRPWAFTDRHVNTVNTAGAKGKGLALQFKKAFPANCKAYEAEAKAGAVPIRRPSPALA
jgi:hypothetical protein